MITFHRDTVRLQGYYIAMLCVCVCVWGGEKKVGRIKLLKQCIYFHKVYHIHYWIGLQPPSLKFLISCKRKNNKTEVRISGAETTLALLTVGVIIHPAKT